MTLKRLGRLSLMTIYYFVIWFILIWELTWFFMLFPETDNISSTYLATSVFALSFLPFYVMLYKRFPIIKLAKTIFLIILIVLLFSINSSTITIIGLSPILLIVLTLIHLYRIDIKSWLTYLKVILNFKNSSEIPSQDIISARALISKFLPLVIFYLLVIVILFVQGDYESIITLTVTTIPIIYIFNKNPKIELVLRWVLYIFIALLFMVIADLFYGL